MHRIVGWMLALSLSPLGLAHSLKIENAWVRLLPGSTTAAYMTLINPALKESVKIVGVSSPIAARVSLHTTSSTAHMGHGEMTGMKPLDSLTIPPKGRLELKPGGIHLMLEGLKQPLKLGQKVRLVLRFADGDTQALEATVRNQ